MARAATLQEPNLPWTDYGEDRGFRWLSAILLVMALVFALIVNSIQLPEPERKNLVDVSPRLAQLIVEKQKPPPPPPPKEKPREKPKPKKKEVKQEKKPEPKKPEPKKAEKKPPPKSDREVAQQSGLIALADELEDLRESFALDELSALPQSTAGKKEVEIASASEDVLSTATAARSSGGIQTDTLSRNITTSELAQRKTVSVESKIESDATRLAATKTTSAAKKGSAEIRSADEIERVFQEYKGGIFNLYNRALRNNPSLAGKVVVELTIAPNGSVTGARILSSELDDPALERKLLLKIKRFKFSNAKVAEITVTYPIDFLPS